MSSTRTLLGMAAILVISGSAAAQSFKAERPDFRLHVQAMEPTLMDRLVGRSSTQGLSLKLTGAQGLASDFGVYGRLGAGAARPPVPGPAAQETSSSYGVGLSWDFSRRGSAVIGWDSYDFRSLAGDRDVRATSLGLQWRY